MRAVALSLTANDRIPVRTRPLMPIARERHREDKTLAVAEGPETVSTVHMQS
jgi:hypothetical protein